MDEHDILSQIHDPVQAEHDLRDGGHEAASDEAEKLRTIERVSLLTHGDHR